MLYKRHYKTINYAYVKHSWKKGWFDILWFFYIINNYIASSDKYLIEFPGDCIELDVCENAQEGFGQK